MIHFFEQHFLFFIAITTLIGMIIGSFLNVVAYRLPKILEQHWKQESKKISLATPSSHCPKCKAKVPFYLNIPVLGYFFAKGKCQACKTQISYTYPLVEALSGLASGLIAYKWGFSLETLAALIFTWFLFPLVLIDIKHEILPDILTLLGIWFGLGFNLLNLFTPLQDAVIGAISGYIFLWLIAQLFLLIRKKEGIGYGDFKLFAMIGAWQGWQALPFILLFASVLGILAAIVRVIFKKQKLNTPIAFGPYLAISSWIFLFFEKQIISLLYL